MNHSILFLLLPFFFSFLLSFFLFLSFLLLFPYPSIFYLSFLSFFLSYFLFLLSFLHMGQRCHSSNGENLMFLKGKKKFLFALYHERKVVQGIMEHERRSQPRWRWCDCQRKLHQMNIKWHVLLPKWVESFNQLFRVGTEKPKTTNCRLLSRHSVLDIAAIAKVSSAFLFFVCLFLSFFSLSFFLFRSFFFLFLRVFLWQGAAGRDRGGGLRFCFTGVLEL